MTIRFYLLTICFIFLILVNGCGKEEDTSSKFEKLERRLTGQKGEQTKASDKLRELIAGKKTQGLPEGTPADFFPMDVGLRWEYKIELGIAEPLIFRETIWPRGKGAIVSQTRGRLLPRRAHKDQKTFSLTYRVHSEAKKQGPLEFPRGVELKFEKDDLGIFEYAEKVFWAISLSRRYMAHQVMIFSPHSPGAPSGGGPWGGWGVPGEGGHTIRVIFFGGKPGIEIGLGEEPTDTLEFKKIDLGVPGYQGIQCLHFTRTIKPAKRERVDKADYLDKSFSEDVWYAKQKGLVRLVQKVEGVISMTWALQKLSKP